MPVKKKVTSKTSPKTSQGPNTNSLFILFEGPWLIDQTPDGRFRATTFDQLQMDSGNTMTHICEVGFGQASGIVVNPLTGAIPPLQLPGGTEWTIAPAVSATRVVKATTTATLFKGPFERPTVSSKCVNDVFVFVKNPQQTLACAPLKGDRVVHFPTADNVYIAGRLAHGIVGDDNQVLNQDTIGNQPPMPFITVIFEYTNPSAAALQLQMGSSQPINLQANNHLIFRMLHKDTMPMPDAYEIKHVEMAFDELWSRVANDQSLRLTKVTKLKKPITSDYMADFEEPELGLAVPTAKANRMKSKARSGIVKAESTLPSNCGGGGIILC